LAKVLHMTMMELALVDKDERGLRFVEVLDEVEE
jgi:hypothetical protein